MTWVSDYLSRRRAELERDLGIRIGRTLGCGSFGCAVEVRKGQHNLVLKLTVDRDEAAMWKRLLELTGARRIDDSGLVGVIDVGEIAEEVTVPERTADLARRGLVLRPNPRAHAYAVLREPIHPLTKGDHDELSRETREVVKRYGALNWGLFARAIDHIFAAGRLYNEIRYSAARRGVRLADVLESTQHFAHEQVQVDVRDIDSEEAALRELTVWIGALHRVPFATDLSRTLATCMEAGIVFADLKISNLGWRAGTGATKRQVVIFDVGGTPVP